MSEIKATVFIPTYYGEDNLDELFESLLKQKTDFEYEIQIAQTNAKLNKDLDTMFFTTSIEYSYVSSTIVKEIASYHGDISEMVPPYVQECLEKKFKAQEAK